MNNRLIALLLIAVMFLTGCGVVELPSIELTEPVISGNTTILPKNVLQIGDSFEVYPDVAGGHFICTVTDVRVVSEQSQCPPVTQFHLPYLGGVVDGKDYFFEYDEWFTEGGPFDQGTRIMLVDLTVTNVDAVAWLDNGMNNSECGYYWHDYAFPSSAFVNPIDLTNVYGSGKDQYYHNAGGFIYFSRRGEYLEQVDLTEEEITDSLGDEETAIAVKPGETVSFTIGYSIHGEEDGTPADLSLWWLCIPKMERFNSVNYGVFIDTKLGDET